MADGQSCPRGTVTRITLTNFTTFLGTRTVRPNPGLNLVCGPNGSGKSTLVSAICLGLGFSDRVIDSQKKAEDYISNGAENCELQIELSNGGEGRTTFLRRIFRGKTRDVFLIDNKKIPTKTEYVACANDYGVYLDNLTQYLPQVRHAWTQSSRRATPLSCRAAPLLLSFANG
jgi:chromosome segregation ATPase